MSPRETPENTETAAQRKRRPSLATFIARAQRAAQRIGLAVKAVEEKPDGARVAHFGTPATDNTNDTNNDAPDRSEWH